jgi:hypothetical protein
MRTTPGNILYAGVGLGLMGVFAVILLGCGLALNAASDAGQPTVVAPAALQSITGCSNPNTGSSNGDWGVGTNPVFTDPLNVVVGAPIYDSNSIFWTSPETAPGESILLTGAFTEETKRARVAFVPSGTTDWQSLVRGSVTVVPTIQQGTTGLSFIVPSDFPAGVYGFEIEDPAAPAVLGLANVPSLSWVIGVPSTTDAATALQHQVHDCGAEAGELLRIFGKNFTPSSQVIIQASDLAVYRLTPSQFDSNSIAVTIPAGLAPGTYSMWVGSAPWSATSSLASQIAIYAPPSWTVRNANCSNLAGDGSTDNTSRLQACLDWLAPLPGSNELVYIAIPAGSFVLTGGVRGRPFEVLVGSSSASTHFLGRPRGAPPAAWFSVPQYFGLADLSLKAPANPNLLISDGSTTGAPATSGHLFFSHLDFQSISDASNGAESMFVVAGPDIQVYNSFFLSGSNQVFDVDFGDGSIVSGNQFVLNNFTGLGVGDSQNVIFEDNLTYSQNLPGLGVNGHSGGSGLSIGRAFSQYGPSALSRDIYVGYNTFRDMGSSDQQIITNDGDGGAYYGPIASSTASTVVLQYDPAWNWMGTTNPQASVMAIIAGRGVGQYSFLQSYSGRTIHLMTPWKVLPDATSVVVISQYEQNMTFAHNTITNTLGVSIVLGDSLEGLIEENVLTNSGDGILLSAFGPYGGPAAYGPVINTEILRNTVTVGDGNFIVRSPHNNFAGIGILDMPGCLLSGLMIRGNAVTSLDTIYSTNGLSGITANVIEQNRAYWQPTFAIPGFLIQDNSPPLP